MSKKFTDKAQKALHNAQKFASYTRSNYIGTEHLLVGLLREKEGVASSVLIENGLEEAQLTEMIREYIRIEQGVVVADKDGYTPLVMRIIEESHKYAKRFRSPQTGTEHLLLALVRDGDNTAVRLLINMGIQIQKIMVDILVAMGEDVALIKEELSTKAKGKKKDNTSTLNQYSRDLTQMAREGKLDPVIGREREIQRVIQILSRRLKNNPCLVGEPGVGKTSIAEGLALRIVAGKVPATVRDKRVVTLDLSGMVAGSKYRGEFEERIKKLIKEVIEDGNIILFLDELHTLIGAGGAEGAIDASNILKPSLARGEIQLIGATTMAEYRKYVEKDAALERRFQPVQVEEPTQEEALEILRGIAPKYEEHHGVVFSQEAIEAAVKLSTRYISDRYLPDKAIDVLDEAASVVRLEILNARTKKEDAKEDIALLERQLEEAIMNSDLEEAARLRKNLERSVKLASPMKSSKKEEKIPEVGENEVAKIVSMWTKIPLEKLAEKESERLLKLEKVLHERVIGQEEPVSAVARAIKRGRVGLQDPNRPIGSFLFLGPTGVGKTELSKALAEAIFGSENALIRVDMSEYMEQHSVSKMVGSPPGYVGFEEGGQLSDKIRRNPYSVVLFDEVEKAHPDVFNILLQVLDDGHITDAKGRKVSFKNTIIIMTSNAGAQRIVEPKNLGFVSDTSEKKEYDKMKSGVMEEVKRLFKPEFLNRIDEIMVFHTLNKENMMQIMDLLGKNLVKRCHAQLSIDLKIQKSLKLHIVERYMDVKMGARPLKRAIQSVIEDALADEILRGTIREGDVVHASFKGGKVSFEVK